MTDQLSAVLRSHLDVEPPPGDLTAVVRRGRGVRRRRRARTTLAVVALDAAFTRLDLQRIARAATAAYHRRLAPAGSSFDGDIVFSLSPMEGRTAPLAQAEMLAVAALEEAIERAVRLAKGRDGIPGLAD